MNTSAMTVDATSRKNPGALAVLVDGPNPARLADQVKRADTFLTRLVGLLGRRELPEGEGLWISPCKGIHTMGMRFPIDALFLDRGNCIVAMREQVVPWRMTRFFKGAESVLELQAGAISRSGVAVGDRLSFSDADKKTQARPCRTAGRRP